VRRRAEPTRRDWLKAEINRLLAPQAPTVADSSKGAKAPIGSGPVQDAELQAIDQSFSQAGDRLAKRSRSACRAFAEVVRTKLEQGLSAVRIYHDLIAEHDYIRVFYPIQNRESVPTILSDMK